jgi:hypothetical protein
MSSSRRSSGTGRDGRPRAHAPRGKPVPGALSPTRRCLIRSEPTYPPTLPGAAPTSTQCSVSSLSITNYNTHRPHRSLHQRPPTDTTPPLSTATIRPLRRDRLGGLIHEYVLSHDMTGFSAPTGERGGNVLGDHPRQLGRCSPVDAPRVVPIENTGRTTGAGYGCTTPGTPADCQRRNRRPPP